MLTKIHLDLIELINAEKIVSSKNLMNYLLVSKRSIINYVHQINDEYPGLIISSTKGYSINKEVFPEISKNYYSTDIEGVDDRLSYLIEMFVNSPHNSIDIIRISYTLFVSEATVRSDLYRLRDRLDDFNLTLKINRNMAEIIGNEIAFRNFIMAYFLESHDFYIENLQNKFSGLDIEWISNLLNQQLPQYLYNDFVRINIISHIIITIMRIRSSHSLQPDDMQINEFIRVSSINDAQTICSLLEKHYDIVFSETEVLRLALLISSYRLPANMNEIAIENLSQYLWPSCYQMMLHIQEKIKEYFKLDLMATPNLFIGLCLHVRNIIHRSTAQFRINNPYVYEIKDNHPAAYDGAVFVAGIINEWFNINIGDDEIAFIAMHIGGIMETTLSVKGRLNVAFVIPKYYRIDEDLINYYTGSLDKYVNTFVITDNPEELYNIENLGLVVTTMRNKYDVDCPVVTIGPFKNEIDKLYINRQIEKLRSTKRISHMRSILKESLSDDHFFTDMSFSSKEECLIFISEHICNEYHNESETLKSLQRREEISPTTLGRVGTPNIFDSEEDSPFKSCVLILTTPLDWDDRSVQLIFAIRYGNKKRPHYDRIIRSIRLATYDKNHFSKLIKARSADEFINFLFST